MVPRRALRPHPGVEVSLAFSLDPAPHGFRFGVRAIPAVPTHVLSNLNQPALLTRLVALRIDPPGASPLPPRPAPYLSPNRTPLRASGAPSPLSGFRLREHGPTVSPPSSLPAHFYMCRSSAGSSRFSFRTVALRLRSGCSEPIAFAESFFPLSGSLGTQVMF